MTQSIENEDQYGGAAPTEVETSEEAPAPDGAGVEQDIQGELARERERSDGYLEELQRERASFINYRRRMEQEKESWSREANAALIFNILPVLDDFERARGAIPTDQQGSAWVDGLMLVGRKLDSTLELAGLKAIDAVGKPFDPALHEAVSVEEGADGEPQIVVEEYRKGYTLGDRVLRPSMVKVTR